MYEKKFKENKNEAIYNIVQYHARRPFLARRKLRKIHLETMAWDARYPRIRADLLYVPTDAGHFIVKEPDSARYFKLSKEAVRVMQHLDGVRSLEDLSTALGLKPIAVRYLVQQLEKLQLLDTKLLENNHKEARAKNTTRIIWRWGSRFIFMRKDIITSDVWMDSLYRNLCLRFLFRPWLLVVLLGLYISAGVIYMRYSRNVGIAIASLFIQSRYHLAYFVIGGLILLVSSFLHELAHGFVCKHFGGRVRAIGIGVYFLRPAFYCDITDAYMFSKRSQRILTHSAGLLMNLLLVSLALLLLPFVTHSFWAMEVVALLFLISGIYSLFNLNPLMQLDGYYVLMDMLGMENMRMKALTLLFISIHAFFEKLHLAEALPALDRRRYSRREQRFLMIYALLSLPYTAFMLWYLSMRYSELLPGSLENARWLLASVCIIILFILPLWRIFQQTVRQMRSLQAFFRDERVAIGHAPKEGVRQ